MYIPASSTPTDQAVLLLELGNHRSYLPAALPLTPASVLQYTVPPPWSARRFLAKPGYQRQLIVIKDPTQPSVHGNKIPANRINSNARTAQRVRCPIPRRSLTGLYNYQFKNIRHSQAIPHAQIRHRADLKDTISLRLKKWRPIPELH